MTALETFENASNVAWHRALDRREPLWVALSDWLEIEYETLLEVMKALDHEGAFETFMAHPAMQAETRFAQAVIDHGMED